MKIIFDSCLLVAIAEMGDKTQFIAFILASRFKKPWTVLSGIFFATVFNHLFASYIGIWIADHLPPNILRWSLGIIFIIFSLWMLFQTKKKRIKI